MTSEVDKLPLETKPVARDNNPGHQTFLSPCTTNKHNKDISELRKPAIKPLARYSYHSPAREAWDTEKISDTE